MMVNEDDSPTDLGFSYTGGSRSGLFIDYGDAVTTTDQRKFVYDFKVFLPIFMLVISLNIINLTIFLF